MGSSVSGFRVVEGQGPQLLGDPRFVFYRLDPATLAPTELSGNLERLLGFPLRDWFGARFWTGRLHPEDREATCAFFRDWALARRDEQLEYRVVDAAGNTVWVHQIICVEREGRQEVGIRGVLIDITARMARESEVQGALFLKSELFRMIVEELGPPMRAISVYGDMLGRHLAAQRDDVGSDFAVGLRDGLERLDTTLGQLMRLAQSGGVPDGGFGGAHRGNPVG
jgi:signal transduction histidine kinase